MGRNRGHSKINSMPPELIATINDLVVNKKKTYKEIQEWLKEQGQEVSQSAICRHSKELLTKLESLSVAKEQAKAIIETSNGLKTEMSEATSTVAFQLLMEMLINKDGKNLDKAAIDAIKALATLERSTVSREKLKLTYDKGVKAASEIIKAELREELKNHPDIIKSIDKIIDKVAEKVSNDKNS